MKNLYSSSMILAFVLCASYARTQVTFTDMGSMLQSIGTVSYADCAADMDGDGYDDVVRVVSNGIYIDYQQANGSFTPAFFPMSITNLPSWSICAADIDGNGYTDLLLGAGNAVSFVYANDNGTGFIEDAHPEYIFTQRSTFADIDNDGNLDAFCNHDVDQCHPYRNTNGVLELDFTLIQTLDAGGNYAAIWVDYDNDWDSDLYITKCRGGALWGDPQRINLLYRNNGDGTYTEVGAQANLNDGNQSWTTVFEDFDNDGDFDAFTVNHASSDVPGGAANKFMQNNGDGTFTDIIGTTGINPADLGAWNCDAGDFDNDGFVDILSEMSTEFYWNNGDGTFTGAQLSGFNSGGIGDFNNDGFLDMISGNSLMINNGNQNHYIKFDLEGIVSNKSAVGSRIEIYGDWGMQIREVRAGESFDPGSSLIAHFGVGQSTSITQAIIKWPSGMVTVLDNPAIDQTHHVIEAGCMGDPVTITADGPTTICPGQSVTLNAPAGSSYTWSNGASTQSIEATNGGNYSVIVWNASNC
ncbi:MAG: FG-GAP-like repeat-containing protein, partial [Flavobacteriales bacterium]